MVLEALIHTRIELSAIEAQAEGQDAIGRRAFPLQVADGLTGDALYFQGSDDAARVVGVDALGGNRIDLPQLIVQGLGGMRLDE